MKNSLLTHKLRLGLFLLAAMLLGLAPNAMLAQQKTTYTSYTYDGGSSDHASNQGPNKLVDNQKTSDSKWCVPGFSSYSPIYVEFHSTEPIVPVGYVMTTGGDNATYTGRNPKSWVIKAKRNSGDNWSTIVTQTNNTTLQDQDLRDYTFNISNSTEYQYFRFEVSAIVGGDNCFQLTELQFQVNSDHAEIGTGTSTTGNAPVYGNYKSSYAQMIYTKSQLNAAGITAAGTITKIGFNSSAANDYSRKPIIYMGNTSQTSFSSNNYDDFVSIDDLEEVYNYSSHSQWSIVAGWNEFELDTPFEYDGSSNIVIAVHCGLISSYTSSSFYCTSTTNYQVIYAYNDTSDPIPSTYDGDWSNYSGNKSHSTNLPNLRLYYTEGSGSGTPSTPTGLAVSSTTSNTASLTWSGSNATSYDVSYRVGSGESVLWGADFEGTDAGQTPAYYGMYDCDDDGDNNNHNFTNSNVHHDDDGSHCAQSKNYHDNSYVSCMTITKTLTSSGTLSFWYKISSESGWDKGYFTLNNAEELVVSGEVGWTQYSKELTAGNYTLTWSYEKDSNGDSGDDRFYIDDIKITTEPAWTTVTANSNSITLTGLTPSTTYSVKVRGKNGTGTGDYCEPITFTTDAPVVSYTISASSVTGTGVSGGGTISGTGSYNQNASCTLTATPAEGYTFWKWTTNNSTTSLSTNTSYSFTVTSAASYRAWFVRTSIANTSQWDEFCGTVNGGHDYSGKTVTMTANVTTAVTTICGTSSSTPFKGTFNGQGHTLNVNISGSSQGTAPFMYLDGATIQNLTVTGSVSSSAHHAAGLVGFTYNASPTYSSSPVSSHDVTIRNCHVSVDVTNTSSNYIGGIVGHAKVNHTSIIGCVYDGTLSSAGYKGGIIGWSDRSQVTITDTYFNGTNSGNGSFNPVGCKTQTQNDNNVTVNLTLSNFYHNYSGTIYTSVYAITYNTSYASTVGNMHAYSITGNTGVTVAMIGDDTNYNVSGITSYEDNHGLLYNSIIYSGNGETVAITLGGGAGYGADYGTLTNVSGNSYTLGMAAHNTVISITATKPLHDSDGNYMTWDEFAANVNGGNTYSGKTVYLDEDITTAVTAMAGTSTGAQDGENAFKGTFDGQGHTLTIDLTKGSTSTHTAPFVYINGATIKDLNVEGEINIGNNQFAGGLVGLSEGANTITNCKVNVTINSTISDDGTHGGFVSIVTGGTTTFNGCAFTGQLLGSSTTSCGGFVGFTVNGSNKAKFNNCIYNPAKRTLSTESSATFSRDLNNSGSNVEINNCYYKETFGTAQGKLKHTVTKGEGVSTMTMSGTPTANNVSGITSYASNSGLLYNGTIIAGDGDDVSLNLSTSSSGGEFYASSGTLTGSGNPYTLNMPNEDVVVGYGVPVTITVTANTDAGGTVTGGGSFHSGQSCTVVATPNNCYQFVNWTVNNEVVSTNSSYTFTVGSSDLNVVANFKATVDANDITVSGSTAISPGSTTTLTAGGISGSGVSYEWYSDAECTQLVHTGASFETTALTNTTTYYVKAVKEGDEYAGTPESFGYTDEGVQTYNIPSGASSVKLEVWGAQGGDNNSYGGGGKGGYSVGTLNNLSDISNLYVYVGQQPTGKTGGWNGGGGYSSYGTSGGGATDISLHNYTFSTTDHYNDRIIVAGGGGGRGYQNTSGGYGGGLNGGAGTTGTNAGGGGGTQTSGGTCYTSDNVGIFGSACADNTHNGGGGGGGWYGGGAGQGGSTDSGAGGGSGYVWTSSTASSAPSGYSVSSSYYLTDAQTIAGNATMPNPDGGTMTGREGHGYARITPYYQDVCESEAKAVTVTVQCTLTYDKNHSGATGTMTDSDSPYNYGATVTVLDNGFTAPSANYVFGGWNTAADGSGTRYVAGNTFTITANTTLYAVWAPLEIANTTQWNEFCTAVNSGFNYSGRTVTMTDNVGPVITMAGINDDAKRFKGIFNGDCNTLTFNQIDATEQHIAPFRYIYSATIQNLKLAGTVSTTNKFAGGIVGHSKGSSTITNCVNSTSIEGKSGTPNNNGSHGGIIGQVGGNQTITITGCVFDGTMGGNDGNIEYWCGIMGYGNNVSATIKDCIFAPQSVYTGNNSNTICRSDQATPTNCYYTTDATTMSNKQGKQAFAVTGIGGVTVAMAGSSTEYSCSGITAYADNQGLLYKINNEDVIIAGDDDNVNIKLSYTPSTGYQLTGYSADHGTLSDGATTGTNDAYTLTMEDDDTEISAITAEIDYNITYVPASGSNYVSGVSTANYNDHVTVTIHTAEGYQLSAFTVTNNTTSDNVVCTGSGATRSFYMPASDVTVEASFTKMTWVDAVDGEPAGFALNDIDSPEDLAWFMREVNGINGIISSGTTFNATITADIDMSEYVWVPIGFNDLLYYTGTFDGGCHTISGLHIAESEIASVAEAMGEEVTSVGLFGYTDASTVIKNLYVTDANFYAPTGKYLGGIVGSNAGTVQNCYSDVTISGLATKGSLVGTNSGTVQYCYAKSTDGLVGGGTTLTNCFKKAEDDDNPTMFVDYTSAAAYRYGDYTSNNAVKISSSTFKPLVEMLNSGNPDASNVKWIRPKGSLRINGGYPVLVPASSGGSKTGEAMAVASKAGSKSLSYGTATALIAKYNTGGTDAATSEAQADVYVYASGDLGSTAPGTFVHLIIDENAAVTQNGNAASSATTFTATVGITIDNSKAAVVTGQLEGRDWHCFATPLKDAPLGITYDNNVGYGATDQQVHDAMSFNGGYFPSSLSLVKTEFDFYAFSEPHYHWLNLKRNKDSHYYSDTHSQIELPDTYDLAHVVPGRGYLLAIGDNSEAKKTVYLSATGTLQNGDTTAIVTNSGAHLKGYNFLGNPYQSYLDFNSFADYAANSTALWGSGSGSMGYKSFLIYDADKGGFVEYLVDSYNVSFSQGAIASNNPYIHPHQGFFVAKSPLVADSTTVTFTNAMRRTDVSTTYRDEAPAYPLVNLICTDDNGRREVSVIEVERPSMAGALKMKDMLNGKANMYIHWGEEDFSSMFLEGTPEYVPVWFKVAEQGVFTMSWSTANDNFGYLHLVDNLTGADIDCLATDSYTFQGKPSDMKARFRLVFKPLGIEEETETEQGENFAFIVGNELVVTGEGELSFIDLNGRILATEYVHGVQSHITMPKVAVGMYMLRLTNEKGTKVQKIVVRR